MIFPYLGNTFQTINEVKMISAGSHSSISEWQENRSIVGNYRFVRFIRCHIEIDDLKAWTKQKSYIPRLQERAVN